MRRRGTPSRPSFRAFEGPALPAPRGRLPRLLCEAAQLLFIENGQHSLVVTEELLFGERPSQRFTISREAPIRFASSCWDRLTVTLIFPVPAGAPNCAASPSVA